MNTETAATVPPVLRRRIMVVDDHEAVRDIICIFLTDSGYEVAGCATGTEALARLDETRPELILMDLRMPVLDGYETTRRIRQESRWDAVPIIAYSCEADDDSLPLLAVLGFNGCITKPSPLEHIAAVVARFLKHADRTCAA
jgi:two-component system, sensor histidine kinase SagS